MEKELVSDKRGYLLRTVAEAKEIVLNWLREINLVNAIKLGLPEVDDRYHIWRVPLCNDQKKTVGEVVIDAYTTEILADRTTRTEIIIARLLKQDESKLETPKKLKRI